MKYWTDEEIVKEMTIEKKVSNGLEFTTLQNLQRVIFDVRFPPRLRDKAEKFISAASKLTSKTLKLGIICPSGFSNLKLLEAKLKFLNPATIVGFGDELTRQFAYGMGLGYNHINTGSRKYKSLVRESDIIILVSDGKDKSISEAEAYINTLQIAAYKIEI